MLENVSKGETTTEIALRTEQLRGNLSVILYGRITHLRKAKIIIRDMLGHTIAGGTLFISVSINSPIEQTISYIYEKSRRQRKVWLNGELLWYMNDHNIPGRRIFTTQTLSLFPLRFAKEKSLVSCNRHRAWRR